MTDAESTTIPRHVAVIMDGNGRWAKKRGLPRLAGHREGIESVRRIVRRASGAGVGYLTLYAFSKENFKRPADEVSGLFGLLRRFFQKELAKLEKEGVRLRIIGNRVRLPEDVRTLLADAETRTAANPGLCLVIALSYDSREEIAAAARRYAEEVAAGTAEASALDENALSARLYTADIPDPDLVIRTSGEFRLSGFLLWQVAYAEIYVTDTLWPDFREEEFDRALAEYATRERRFGGLGED